MNVRCRAACLALLLLHLLLEAGASGWRPAHGRVLARKDEWVLDEAFEAERTSQEHQRPERSGMRQWCAGAGENARNKACKDCADSSAAFACTRRAGKQRPTEQLLQPERAKSRNVVSAVANLAPAPHGVAELPPALPANDRRGGAAAAVVDASAAEALAGGPPEEASAVADASGVPFDLPVPSPAALAAAEKACWLFFFAPLAMSPGACT